MAMDTPEMFEAGLGHIYPEFRSFWGKTLETMSESGWNGVLSNIIKTSLIDEIWIDHGSWWVVECINKEGKTHNYVVDTNNSGIYEIKVISDKPTGKIDEVKK